MGDRGKLWRALKRLGRQDYERYGIAAPFVRPATLVYYGANILLHRDRLDARLELIAVIRAAKDQRNPEHPTSGFGRLDAFDGTRNFIFTRLRKADAAGDFEVNRANMVTLDAAVKFPPLWSRKARAPEPVEAYRNQPQRFPPVWGFKDTTGSNGPMDTDTVMGAMSRKPSALGASVISIQRTPLSSKSSIPIKNLHELEWLAYYIDPPQWPAADLRRDQARFGGVRANAYSKPVCRMPRSMAMIDVRSDWSHQVAWNAPGATSGPTRL
jgi:hypothetical protein